MKSFSKSELILVLVTLFVVGTLSYFNFMDAFQRSRDAQRRSDVNSMVDSLAKYKEDFGFVPLSTEDGQIRGCDPGNHHELITSYQNNEITLQTYLESLAPCPWGDSSLRDLSDPKYPAYRESLPRDPKYNEGYSYKYISNGRIFQLYASYEATDEEGYREDIVSRGLMCGNKVCSYGRGFEKTPVEMSLEKYEEQLAHQKSKQ